MSTHDPARQKIVSTVASLSAWHPDDPQLPALRAELATMKLIEFISKTIEAYPPLNPEQRQRLVKAVYANLGNG
jgi:hypothetical protein